MILLNNGTFLGLPTLGAQPANRSALCESWHVEWRGGVGRMDFIAARLPGPDADGGLALTIRSTSSWLRVCQPVTLDGWRGDIFRFALRGRRAPDAPAAPRLEWAALLAVDGDGKRVFAHKLSGQEVGFQEHWHVESFETRLTTPLSRATYIFALQFAAEPGGLQIAVVGLETERKLSAKGANADQVSVAAAFSSGPAVPAPGTDLRGEVQRENSPGMVEGWAYDPETPETPVRLQFRVDGAPVGSVVANRPRLDLRAAGVAQIACGFRWVLPASLLDGRMRQIEVAASNGAALPNSPVVVEARALPRVVHGALDAAPRRGTTLSGWAQAGDGSDGPMRVRLLLDGQPLGEALANIHRRELERRSFANARAGFELPVPLEFHDGKPHVVRLVDTLSEETLAERDGMHFAANKVYENYAEFRRWAFFHREMPAPFTEVDKNILAFLDWKSDHLDARWNARVADGMATPLVSVIMSTRDRAGQIGIAICSVLVQSYQNWELIVVDDGSTDGTTKTLDGFADPRIRRIRLETSQGVSAARNVALEAARGDVFAYLDSDNRMDRRFLSVMLAEMTERGAASAYCGQYRYHSFDAKPVAALLGEFNPGLIANRNFIDLNAFVHTREMLQRAGGFDPELRRFVDWDLVQRCAEIAWPEYVDPPLSHYLYNQAPGTITLLPNVDQDLEKFDRKAASRIQARIKLDEASGEELVLYRDPAGRAAQNGLIPQRPVTVVIPSYGVPHLLSLALRSVLSEGLPRTRIVIVDNASPPETTRLLADLAQSEPRVSVIYNDTNVGFTRAVNQGILVSDPDTDVLIMNNDAIGTEGWLWRLCKARDKLPEMGLLAPEQVLPPYTRTAGDHQPYARPERDVDVNLSWHHRNLILAPEPWLAEERVVEAAFVPFFCVLIRREVLNRLGPLDELRGRHYRSDRIFCDAMREVGGFRLGVCFGSRVYHLLQQSTQELCEQDPELYDAMYRRNSWSDGRQTVDPWE